MFVLKMYVQIMSLSALLCNVCVCYVYILKMSKKIKVKKINNYPLQIQKTQCVNKSNTCTSHELNNQVTRIYKTLNPCDWIFSAGISKYLHREGT
jgi:hypothetical protein